MLRVCLDKLSDDKIKERRHQKQTYVIYPQVPRVSNAETVKDRAADKYDKVARFCRRRRIDYKKKRQKHKDEIKT